MANIFLTPTAEFKPFSYAEMLAPIAAYQEAYDAYDASPNSSKTALASSLSV